MNESKQKAGFRTTIDVTIPLLLRAKQYLVGRNRSITRIADPIPPTQSMNLMPTMSAYVAETHVDPVWQVATDVEPEVTPKARSLSIGSMSVCSFEQIHGWGW